MGRLAKVAAKAEAARRLISPEFSETWDRDGGDAESIIRMLRNDFRREFGNDPNRDIHYMGTGGITLVPVWDEGRIVGYDVHADVGLIKP